MVSEIRIYVEGGGSSNSTRSELRRGYHHFLRELYEKARSNRIRCQTVVCGPRENAYKLFCYALSTYPDAFNVLLVDAETAVKTNPWQHLEQHEGWDRKGTSEEQCHLMVQAMEAWFMADPHAVRQYFGNGFYINRLPGTKNVENIPKADLEGYLHAAAKKTNKKGYSKIRDGAALLTKVRSEYVCQNAKHCKRLFDTIRKELE